MRKKEKYVITNINETQRNTANRKRQRNYKTEKTTENLAIVNPSLSKNTERMEKQMKIY